MMHGGAPYLENIVRRIVHQVLGMRMRERIGMVSAYDPKTHTAKVMLKPEDVETTWLPIETQHIGDGYGLLWGPEIDDQVRIGFLEDDPSSPFVVGRVHNDEQKPPKVEAGEMLIKSKKGVYFFIDKDNQLTIYRSSAGAKEDPDGSRIQIDKDDNVTIMRRHDNKDGSFVLIDKNNKVTMQHQDGSQFVLEGNKTASIKADNILLDGTVVLGGREQQRRIILEGDPDTHKDKSIGTQDKVWWGGGSGTSTPPPRDTSSIPMS